MPACSLRNAAPISSSIFSRQYSFRGSRRHQADARTRVRTWHELTDYGTARILKKPLELVLLTYCVAFVEVATNGTP